MSVTRLDIFADYFQFYLTDPAHHADLSDVWTPQATADRFIDLPVTAVLGTGRNCTVPVVLERHCIRPGIPKLIADADHAVLFGIENRSGEFKIAGCAEPLETAYGFNAAPGYYGIVYMALGLGTVTNLDGEDSYHIHIWPTSVRFELRHVLRRHPAR